MAYEIWDAETGNLQGVYESEAAALDALGQGLRHHGANYAGGLLLGFEDEGGDSHLITSGEQLVQRVQEHQASPAATV